MGNVYQDEVSDLASFDSTDDLSFDLFIDPTADPAYKEGQVRYQFKVAEDGVAIFEKVKSDCRISVQRLLWVDGWRDGKNAKQAQQMTLVVLKFNFLSTARASDATRLAWVRAGLSFWDTDEHRHQDPEVVAWAPCEPEKWNFTTAHRKDVAKIGGKIGAGYQGVEVSVDKSKEGEIQWDQQCFDEGHTQHTHNKKTGRPNGVTWFLRQNPLQNHGIMPQFWAALLISRQSSKEYLVRFTLESGSGSTDNAKITVSDFLGLREDGSTFSVTPKMGEVAVCNLEGQNIIKAVDPQHLGALVDPEKSTKLNVKWGPRPEEKKPDAQPETKPETKPEEDKPKLTEPAAVIGGGGEKREVTQVAVGGVAARVPSAHQVAPVQAPQLAVETPPPPREVAAWEDRPKVPPTSLFSSSDADYARLVALEARAAQFEARAAQLEARLAAQDIVLLQMQQAMLAKDAQLSRIEQRFAPLSG